MCLGLKITLITLGSLFGAAVLFFLAFLYLSAPGRRPRVMEKYKKIKYAHRGLHGESIPEKSLAAFAEAKRAGYGVELDVRLSRDGRLVVFHDDTLLRMCGVDGRVSDYTYGELSKMRLLGTDEKIPLFSQVLDLLGGEVALLVEIKMKTGDTRVAEETLLEIKDYNGPLIVESFNPFALRVVKKARPDIPRGILSMNYMNEEKHKGKLLYRLLKNLCLNFLMRPDFLSYRAEDSGDKALRLIRRLFATPTLAWTVTSAEEEKRVTEAGFDSVIFEDYLPNGG